jgi:hypothetical protein
MQQQKPHDATGNPGETVLFGDDAEFLDEVGVHGHSPPGIESGNVLDSVCSVKTVQTDKSTM